MQKKTTIVNEKQTIKDVILGKNVKIYDFVNLYGCEIGDETRIGTFTEIQKGVKIGKKCKIQSHTFLCEGVEIEDEVFIGHNVVFINDKTPKACINGKLVTNEWKLLPVKVKKGATIGSGAIIMGGVEIGENALVGAGAVVTKNVPAGETVVGIPARSVAVRP